MKFNRSIDVFLERNNLLVFEISWFDDSFLFDIFLVGLINFFLFKDKLSFYVFNIFRFSVECDL